MKLFGAQSEDDETRAALFGRQIQSEDDETRAAPVRDYRESR